MIEDTDSDRGESHGSTGSWGLGIGQFREPFPGDGTATGDNIRGKP